MRILLAPDKFKGSLTALEVCEAMRLGIHDFDQSIEVISHPLADGGEGTSDLLESALGLKRITLTVNDPLFRPVSTWYLRNEQTAFIEMANASGLPLLKPEERNAMLTTTLGTGEIIAHALEHGVSAIYLMIGGSATTDGGTGMASALGYEFITQGNEDFLGNGAMLKYIRKVVSDNRLERIGEVTFTVLCDVQNPLFGSNGSACVYGPQKGADAQEVIALDEGLRHLSEVLNNGYESVPGAGAAGGLGYGAMSFLGAKLKPGIGSVMEITGFENQLESIDLIISGEGKMDLQTVEGKVIAGVAQKSRSSGIPFGVICGMTESIDTVQEQIKAFGVYPLVNDQVKPEFAMSHAFDLVRERTRQLTEDFVRKNR